MLFTGCEKDKKPDDCMGDDLLELCIHGGFSSQFLGEDATAMKELRNSEKLISPELYWCIKLRHSLPCSVSLIALSIIAATSEGILSSVAMLQRSENMVMILVPVCC
mgnify:CR=1 FL=1